MSDALLGLDPADFGTTGLTLGLLVGVALNEPERVLDRGRVYGRGGGAETMQSWRHRAVTELLRRHGVDLDTLLPAVRPEPVPVPTVREVVLARVRTDDDAFRVFEPGGVGTGFLTYDPVTGERGTVTFDRVNAPAFDADREAAVLHDLLGLRDELAVYDRLEYLYRRLITEETGQPVLAGPIDPRPGDIWHDACPSITGGQYWHARDDGNGGVELYEDNGPGLVRADAVKSMRGGMTLIHREHADA